MDHLDYGNLVSAAKVMNSTGGRINEAIRDNDNKNKVEELSQRLLGLSVPVFFGVEMGLKAREEGKGMREIEGG